MAILILIIGIILFIGLIVVHEFGHFLLARRNGVEVEEFGIFFGPAIYKRKTKGGWIFKINTVPLGGYVKLKGEHDSDQESGSYGAASVWAKTKIMSAGVISNLIAGVLLLIILALIGMPQLLPNQFTVNSDAHNVKIASLKIDSVLPGTPAARAGLKAGEGITAVGPKNNLQLITSATSLQTVTAQYAGQKVYINYVEGKAKHQTEALLNTKAQANSKNGKIYLGISINAYTSGLSVVRYTWSAPVVALGLTKQVIVLSYQGVGHALRGIGGIVAGAATNNTAARKHAQTSASNQVVGPVGIFVILKDSASAGFSFMLFIIAIISLTLAIMNILPIPALDGGRLWLTLITRGIRKPVTANAEEMINAIGMLVLLALIALVTYVDIRRFF